MKKWHLGKRIASVLLALVMVFSLIQISPNATWAVKAEESAETAFVVGTLNLLDEENYSCWVQNDKRAQMKYVADGIYVETITFPELTEEKDIEYKVAFNGKWEKSYGDGAGNIKITLPAGTNHFVVVCDDKNGKVFDSIRNEDEIETTVSLIGTVRGDGAINWAPTNTEFDFDYVNGAYVYQKVLAKGDYAYKIIENYENWFNGADKSLSVAEDDTLVTFAYDAVNKNLVDSVNNPEEVAKILRGEVAERLDAYKVVFHYNNANNWEKVNGYIKQGSTWADAPGYGYIGGWPGAEIAADEKNEGWYSCEMVFTDPEIHCIFTDGNGNQTSNVEPKLEKESTELWVQVDGSYTETAPEGWGSSDSYPAPINPNAGSTVKSPVVNDDNTVTLSLPIGTRAETDVVDLMGTLTGTDWSTGLPMELSEDKTVFTVTTPVQSAGVYQYKFRINGSDWITDPLNEEILGGNSKVVVAGLEATELDVKRGEATELPKTLELFDADGTSSEVGVSYTLKDATLAEVVTLEDGKVTVKGGSTCQTVVLVATAGDASSEVTLNVKDQVYTYNIYYYDPAEEHMSTDAAGIWLWENGGATYPEQSFTSKEVLADGNEWLKAEITCSATDFGFIPKSKGSWDWQTGNHTFNNVYKDEVVDLYVVYGDDAHTYTELPEIKELRERYVVVEYNRPENDYEGWNIYSWNTGMGSETELYIQDVDGKKYIIVPVKDSEVDFTLGFCMRRTTEEEPWAEKDGGDHYVNIPADQTVVKVTFEQGEGIVSTLPYSTDYVMNGKNGVIDFYYRDDMKLLDHSVGTLEDVKVVVDGEEYDMVYDEETERFAYAYEISESGTHTYFFKVAGENVSDEKEVTYKKFDGVTATASVYNEKMDYNDNNVLSVNLTSDGEEIATEEVKEVKADLTALGYGVIDVNPELMEVTFGVTRGTKNGKKDIPVTVTDIYGNEYETSTSVNVTKRDADDFDWDEAVIYMTCTDRFFDGNASNNDGVDKEGSLSYHGGDFAGLEAKLDYLESLGINTIWITPIVENSDTTTEKDGETIESTGYHGYWASDFEKLNPQLGTEEEFAALIDAVHAHDMKIMVDVVLNHAGYTTEDYFNQYMDTEDKDVTMIRDSSNTISGDDKYASLAGLPDFVTEDEEVRNQLIEWQVAWMEDFDIDYYRIDTVKHVDDTTWAAFRNALAKVNPNFKIIGEYAGAGYANDAGQLGTGLMDSLLDFDFNGQSQAFVTGNLAAVESYMTGRNAAINNTKTVGAFLSSHDEDSFVDTLINQNGKTEEEALALARVAASLQLTAKGQVVIYYGEEIGQHGLNNYPYQTNRYDMDWSMVESQTGDESSMLAHYTTLLGIREEYKELFANGTRESILLDDENDFEVFARSYGKQTLYVGLNINSEAKEATFAVSEKAGSKIKDLYSGEIYTVAKDGTVTVTIPEAQKGGTVILTRYTVIDEIIDVVDPIIDDIIEVIKPIIKPETKPETKPGKPEIGHVISSIISGITNNPIIQAILPVRPVRNPVAQIPEREEVKVEDHQETEEVTEEVTTDEIEDEETPLVANDTQETGTDAKAFPIVPVAAGVIVIALATGAGIIFVKKKTA